MNSLGCFISVFIYLLAHYWITSATTLQIINYINSRTHIFVFIHVIITNTFKDVFNSEYSRNHFNEKVFLKACDSFKFWNFSGVNTE